MESLQERQERFQRVLCHAQEAARLIPDSFIMENSTDPDCRNGECRLVLPEHAIVSKPAVHAVYQAVFASDVTDWEADPPSLIFMVGDAN